MFFLASLEGEIPRKWIPDGRRKYILRKPCNQIGNETPQSTEFCTAYMHKATKRLKSYRFCVLKWEIAVKQKWNIYIYGYRMERHLQSYRNNHNSNTYISRKLASKLEVENSCSNFYSFSFSHEENTHSCWISVSHL